MNPTDRIMALDLETTSADPEEARIVSAAIIQRGPDVLCAVNWDWLIDPGVPIPPEATAVHGIDDATAALGLDPFEALDEIARAILVAAVTPIPLVIYNAQFDLTVLDRECRRHGVGLSFDGLLVIDPFVIDKELDQFRKGSRKLVDVAAHYHVPAEGTAHGAHADALMAARIAVRQMADPGIASLTPERLHELQIGWCFAQRASLEAYFARKGTPENIRREWPYLPRMS